MKKNILFSLLICIMFIFLSLSAYSGKEVTQTKTLSTSHSNTQGAKWWDKFGKPQYGGTIHIAELLERIKFDPFMGTDRFTHLGFLFPMEMLFAWDWTLDRKIWSFQGDFSPPEYFQGVLVDSWEQTDPFTITLHLRKGIHWQDKPPVNGREFIADDVVEHYHRMMGIEGYNEPSPPYARSLEIVDKVTAEDKYTVVFKFKKPGVSGILTLTTLNGLNTIEPREAVTQGGGMINDWKMCIGTGPWMVSDFVSGSSITFNKNPDYWGTDERHPQNRIPYADEFKMLHISDLATLKAALRTKKIDITTTTNLSWKDVETLQNNAPELQDYDVTNCAYSLTMRVDHSPFNDIRVRKALQLAINLPEIAKNYYGGTVESIPCGQVSSNYKGWYYPYEEWPQKLKNEYNYNPDLSKKLLAESTADGVFKPNEHGGFDTHVLAGSETDLTLLQIVKSYFMDIGVDMEIETMDPTAVFAYCIAGNNDQMFYAPHAAQTYSPTIVISTRFSKAPFNFSHCNDPVYDDAFNRFNSALTIDEAKKAMRDGDEQAIKQHWSVNILARKTYTIYQPYLKGYSGEMMSTFGALQLFSRFWIDQGLK